MNTEFSKMSFSEVVEKVERPPENFVKSATFSLVATDYFLYKTMVKNYGAKKAEEIHCKLWSRYASERFKKVMETQGITEAKDLATLGRVIRFANDLMCRPFKTVVDTPEQLVGIILMDPFVDYAVELFGEKFGGSYFKVLSKATTIFNSKLAEMALGKKVTVTQDKFISLGDDVDRITFEMKEQEN